ncbi:MAG: hypothetical protein ACRD88_14130 [Terriglobia bacterium]
MIIDMQSNVAFVTFKPNAHFDPAVLRNAAEKADTAFPLIQIVARGRIVEEGSKRFLVAGEDRFLLIEPPASAPPLPAASDAVLTVVASVDDSADPIKLKVVQSKPAEP